jgi:diguanylate cyclase (GGDEF)-like protein
VAALLLATVQLIWRHGRDATPSFAPVLAGAYGLLAVTLLVRAVQVLSHAGSAKLSIDAPGRSSLVLVILVMFAGGAINLAQIRLVLGRVLQRLRAQAQSDALTGTANRRGLLLGLEAMHAKAQRGTASGQAGHGYSVLMVDVDHFKAINDSLGHAGGDRALQRVARALRDGLRGGDLIARWGGEEFCVLLPRTTLADAQTLAERLAQRVAASGEPAVTVSIGVAEARAAQETAEDVIRRADAALYLAKQSGRNRVVSSAGITAAPPLRAAE